MDQSETMKENCIFCQIAEGRVQSRKVFEDELVIGILDINPANAGHILLMPKEHYMFMPQVPSSVLSRLFIISRQLSNGLLKALKSEGTSVFIANGGVAGQKAPHFMMHVIPRVAGDGVMLSVPENDIVAEVQSRVKSQVTETLSALFGIKPVVNPAEQKQGMKSATGTGSKQDSENQPQPAKSGKADLDSITRVLAGGKDD
ncbi:HIT domain-containing protein [Candidatus Woesearchaeota archaeon]|nr:HIT domain-containing protein [Candidatus Woesearchaeota archaeon]